MSLEGNLRDLELQEVFQLLAHGRKSGQLRITAQLAGLHAVVCFERGSIVNAVVSALEIEYATLAQLTRSRLQVEGAALELLTWRDGVFKFVPATADVEMNAGVRLSTEMLLVEGARRIEGWARLADRIPHARAVPAFVTVEPTHLPLLHLVPQQWEVLTRVDGERDLPALAEALGRDLLEVAEIVYGLIETGLLMLVEAARPVRAMATPPAAVPVIAAAANAVREAPSEDIWVPHHTDNPPHATPVEDEGYDAIFDPVRVGVITPEGLPRLRTPLRQPAIARAKSAVNNLRTEGDEAARRGDFEIAIAKWRASLNTVQNGAEADAIRETIDLVLRLQGMLQTRVTA